MSNSLKKSHRTLRRCIAMAALGLAAGAAMAQEAAPAAVAAASAPAAPGARSWSLRLPEAEAVMYRGLASFDSVGVNSPQMLYPAPNVAGLIAGIITHGLLADSAKERQKTQLQADADEVLAPYRPVLGTYTHAQLMKQGLEQALPGQGHQLVPFADKASGGWRIEVVPVYSMTLDQRALLVDTDIALYAPEAPAAPAYRNVIRVVSQAHNEADPVAFWTAQDGAKLKDESSALLAEALRIALAQLDTQAGSAAAAPTYRTVRYPQGGREMMERAQLLAERCDRLLLKTLRGTLLSVPAVAAGCNGAEIAKR